MELTINRDYLYTTYPGYAGDTFQFEVCECPGKRSTEVLELRTGRSWRVPPPHSSQVAPPVVPLETQLSFFLATFQPQNKRRLGSHRCYGSSTKLN